LKENAESKHAPGIWSSDIDAVRTMSKGGSEIIAQPITAIGFDASYLKFAGIWRGLRPDGMMRSEFNFRTRKGCVS
jgi:hypothetical protein